MESFSIQLRPRRRADANVDMNPSEGGVHLTLTSFVSATPAQVQQEVQRILASGIMEGGRFILREGNNLSPGIALENLWAMYDAVKEFGHYPSVPCLHPAEQEESGDDR